jgi:hypothetical protein
MKGVSHSLRLRLLAALLLVWALGAGAMAVFLQSQAASPDEQLEESSLSTQARDLVGGLHFDRAGRLRRDGVGATTSPARPITPFSTPAAGPWRNRPIWRGRSR